MKRFAIFKSSLIGVGLLILFELTTSTERFECPKENKNEFCSCTASKHINEFTWFPTSTIECKRNNAIISIEILSTNRLIFNCENVLNAEIFNLSSLNLPKEIKYLKTNSCDISVVQLILNDLIGFIKYDQSLVALFFDDQTTIPDSIFKEKTLNDLSIIGNNVTFLPENIFENLTGLERLVIKLSRNNPITLPANIFSSLTKLERLEIEKNYLDSLPEDIFKSQVKLQTLSIQNNQLITLPENIFKNQKRLWLLRLSNNHLTELPENIFANLKNLELLYLDGNNLTTLPEKLFKNQIKMEYLSLKSNKLMTLHQNLMKDLKGVAITADLSLKHDNQLLISPNDHSHILRRLYPFINSLFYRHSTNSTN